MQTLKSLLWARAESLFLKKGLAQEKVKQAALKEFQRNFPADLAGDIRVDSFDLKEKCLKVSCPHPYLASQLRLRSEILRRSIEVSSQETVNRLFIVVRQKTD